jgi:hypothetical protein
VKIHDCEQGSAAWFKLRMGIPTASHFDQILTPARQEISKQRWKYACRLVAERLLNWQAMSLDTLGHIRDGKEREPDAIRQLEFVHEIATKPVGFITTDNGRVGASPDRLTVKDQPVEVKCPTDPVQLEYLLLDNEEAYRCQRQGQLWVAEADHAVFYSYHPRMPAAFARTPRNEAFIKKLAAALDQFTDELDELTEKAKKLGAFQPYSVLLPEEVQKEALADVED